VRAELASLVRVALQLQDHQLLSLLGHRQHDFLTLNEKYISCVVFQERSIDSV
jgi:hypothetical protein